MMDDIAYAKLCNDMYDDPALLVGRSLLGGNAGSLASLTNYTVSALEDDNYRMEVKPYRQPGRIETIPASVFLGRVMRCTVIIKGDR